MNEALSVPKFKTLGNEQLESMAAAGYEVLECHQVLAKTGDNIVKELLPIDGGFRTFDHCPPGDIFDRETASQYYYHAHREDEHGHFHIFLREDGMPEGIHPVEQSEAEIMKERQDKISHLIAISMDQWGYPIGLFTTNRWVTGEDWYAAADVCAMLDRFKIDHAKPSWPTNRWVTAMLQLFRPQIEALVYERDKVVVDWQKKHPNIDVFEDRNLDVASQLEISIKDQMDAVQSALDACGQMSGNGAR